MPYVHPSIILEFGHPLTIARRLDISLGTVRQWLQGDRPIPASRAVQLEWHSNGRVRVEDILPTVRWTRVKDASWPVRLGRPLQDHFQRGAAEPEAVHA